MAITKVSRGLLSTGIVDNSNATAITIDSSENVTLAAALNVTSAATFDSSATFGDDVVINNGSPEMYFGTTGNHYNWRIAAQENVDAAFTIDVGSQDTAYGDDTYSSVFTVKNTGNVGIGNTNPASPLHVSGNFKVNTTTADSNENRFVVVPGGAGDNCTVQIIQDDASTVGVYLQADGASWFTGGINPGSGDTTAANVLDDYEEGTFDASITPASGNYTLNTGYSKLGYTRIGRVVTITGMLVLSAQNGASGAVTIGDLPFEMLNDTQRSSQTRPSIHIFANGTGAPASAYYPAFIAFNEGNRSGTLIVTYNSTHDATPGDWLAGGSDLFINFSYHAA